MLVPATVLVDEVCRLEFALQGIGLVLANSGDRPAEAVVPAEPGRRAPARRTVADRWLEETLYQRALDRGLYP